MARPLLVFDGDCGFCSGSVGVLRDRIGPDVDFEPWQRLDLAALGLTQEQVTRSVWLVEGAGAAPRSSGAAAFARVLLRAARPWRVVGRLLLLPPVSWCAAAVYRVIAANRHRLPGSTPACSR